MIVVLTAAFLLVFLVIFQWWTHPIPLRTIPLFIRLHTAAAPNRDPDHDGIPPPVPRSKTARD